MKKKEGSSRSFIGIATRAHSSKRSRWNGLPKGRLDLWSDTLDRRRRTPRVKANPSPARPVIATPDPSSRFGLFWRFHTASGAFSVTWSTRSLDTRPKERKAGINQKVGSLQAGRFRAVRLFRDEIVFHLRQPHGTRRGHQKNRPASWLACAAMQHRPDSDELLSLLLANYVAWEWRRLWRGSL